MPDGQFTGTTTFSAARRRWPPQLTSVTTNAGGTIQINGRGDDHGRADLQDAVTLNANAT